MDVKCVECGKEYLLNEDDSPESFQCECGGNLETNEDNRPVPQQKTSYNNSVEKKSPILAVILSFLIPGLGQFYNGHGEKGIILFIAALISAFLILFIIGTILYLVVWVFAIFDAYDSADRINKGKRVRVKLTDYQG